MNEKYTIKNFISKMAETFSGKKFEFYTIYNVFYIKINLCKKMFYFLFENLPKFQVLSDYYCIHNDFSSLSVYLDVEDYALMFSFSIIA